MKQLLKKLTWYAPLLSLCVLLIACGKQNKHIAHDQKFDFPGLEKKVSHDYDSMLLATWTQGKSIEAQLSPVLDELSTEMDELFATETKVNNIAFILEVNNSNVAIEKIQFIDAKKQKLVEWFESPYPKATIIDQDAISQTCPTGFTDQGYCYNTACAKDRLLQLATDPQMRSVNGVFRAKVVWTKQAIRICTQ